MSVSPVPDLADVLAARRRIAPYLQPTPLYRYPALDAMTGTQAWVKHENHQPVGAFKVRGGVNLVSQLTEDEKRRGVIAASTGNHGQAIATVGRMLGISTTIVMPEDAPRVKIAKARARVELFQSGAVGAKPRAELFATSARPVTTAVTKPRVELFGSDARTLRGVKAVEEA